MIIEFRLLGPLEVEVDGRVLPVSSGRQRVVLAALLLRRNHPVAMSDLEDKLWEGEPPNGARGVIQKYVMRLRNLLGHELIHTDSIGYRISVQHGLVDLDLFADLVNAADKAREAGDQVSEAVGLRDALALWRDASPLSNVESTSLHRHEVAQLVEQYLQTVERRIEVDLRLGQHATLVGDLRLLARRFSLRERFWGQLMVALDGSGRRGDALEAYQEAARYLADELGVEPGAELRGLYSEILTKDDRSSDRTGGSRNAPSKPIPHQLPMAGAVFVGRREQVAEISAVLTARAGTDVPVVLVSGPAGIGKTALAVQVAHQVAAEFEHGQLYVDLRAFAEGTAPSVSEVLGQFLHALGVTPDAIPLRVDEQVTAFRSLAAGKHLLVVLDNVGPKYDVSSLLPGAPGCAVLITSRNELEGLLVATGARHVSLGTLSTGESRVLLTNAVGRDRLGAEPEAVAELIALCGGFALALRIAGVHLLLRPGLTVSQYVEQLREQGAVSGLSADADETSLSTAFDWSYRVLSPSHQRLLRLLSLVPGPDVTPQAVAALVDVSEADAAVLLDGLSSASLLARRSGRRYAFHDLIRAYARERCENEELASAREEARSRLFDYYIAAADAAVTPAIVVATLERPSSSRAALVGPRSIASLDDERAAMVAAVQDAESRGLNEKAVHLADALRGYFMLRGHNVDWLVCTEAGLRAARTSGDDLAVAAMLNGRGVLRFNTGDTTGAGTDAAAALAIFENMRSSMAAVARGNLGLISMANGSAATAVKHLTRALEAQERRDDLRLAYRTLVNLTVALVGWGDLQRANAAGERVQELAAAGDYRALGVMALLARYSGDLRRAEVGLAQATALALDHDDQRTAVCLVDELTLSRLDLGMLGDCHRAAQGNVRRAMRYDPRRVAATQCTLGLVLARLNEDTEARVHYEEALTAARSFGDRDAECVALIGLSDLSLVRGFVDEARRRASAAAQIATRDARRLRLVEARLALAATSLRAGRVQAAMTEGERALRLALTCGYTLGAARARDVLGQVWLSHGGMAKTLTYWSEAEKTLRAAGSFQAKLVARRLASLRSEIPPKTE